MNSAKIRVAVRVRPLLDNETKNGLQNNKIESLTDSGEVRVHVDDSKQQVKSYKFDHVLDESISQQSFYQKCDIESLLNHIIEGYHATIFAYGQTGSGKTFTMEGGDKESKDDPSAGLIPRAIRSLFQKIHQQSNTRQFTVYVSFLQIYNERIFDLLGGVGKINSGPQGGGLKLRWNPREQFTVENLFVYQCKTAEEVLDLFYLGSKNRVTASHKLNLTSSRSHSIMEIKLESIDNLNPDNFLSSKLELVDLAGSERISLTGAEGKQAKESIEINRSLFILRQVINAVSDSIQNNGQNVHIPYRDSKLTCLLKQSIGGNSFCLMIACLVPADAFLDENISTLQYASKATIIQNLPQKNDDPKNKQIQELKQQIQSLRGELDKANQHIDFLTMIVKKHEAGNMLQSQQPNNTFTSISDVPPADEKLQREFFSHVEKYKTLTQFLKPAVKNKYLIYISSEQPLDYDVFSDRLVDSINMVRELLLSNKEMREREESSNQKAEQLQRELLLLQKENFELRERYQIQDDLGDDRYNVISPQKPIQPQQMRAMKKPNNSQAMNRKPLNYSDDQGFMPEQTTQFQRQLINDGQDPGKRSQLGQMTQIGIQQPQMRGDIREPKNRNQSLPSRGPPIPSNQIKPQLPQIRNQYPIQNTAAQQFFYEEESNTAGDELTNFGRRTLYQNGYNYSQQKIDDQRRNQKR